MIFLKNILKKLLFLPDSIIFYIIFAFTIFISPLVGSLWENDFANYHYYNPWAFLHNRFDTDIVPNGIHGFLNPIIDIPFYLMIQYFNEQPSIVFTYLGIWTSLYGFVAFKLGKLFFDKETIFSRITLYTFTIATLTRFCTAQQMATTTNEITVGFFALWGIYLLFLTLKNQQFSPYKIVFSGFLLGMSFALKSTAITWCFATGATMIICATYFKNFYKTLTLFIIAGITGYLCINGYFMWRNYESYQNPFFPLLNAIFKSEYYNIDNYAERGFVPTGLEILYAPFKWLIYPKINEVNYEDNSLACAYALFLIFVLTLPFARFRKIWLSNPMYLFTIILWGTSYFCWLLLFTNVRYFVVGETLAALLLTTTFFKSYEKIYPFLYEKYSFVQKFSSFASVYITLCLCFCIYVTAPRIIFEIKILKSISSIYKNDRKIISGLEDTNLSDNSLLSLYNNDISFIAPLLIKDKNIRIIGHPLDFWHQKQWEKGNKLSDFGKLQNIAQELEKKYQNNTYHAINIKYYSTAEISYNYNLIAKLIKQNNECRFLPTSLGSQIIYLCSTPDLLKSAFRKKDSNLTTKQGVLISSIPEAYKHQKLLTKSLNCMFIGFCKI